MKSPTYYIFDDTINIKNFDRNKIKIDENSYKDIAIYYIEYMTVKNLSCIKINSVYNLSDKINE